MPSVLFICTANQFRSPLAAALFSKEIASMGLDGHWQVESAGTWTEAGHTLPGFFIQLAKELGLGGLESHRTRPIDLDLLSRFDLCAVMESGHKEALVNEFPSVKNHIHLLSEIVDGIPYDIPDPAKPGVNPDEVARELNLLIHSGADKIVRLANSLARR